MLRCMLKEKARPDVNQAPTLCLWFCFGSSFKVISQQCADSMSLLPVSCPRWVNKLLFLPSAKAARARWRALTEKQTNRARNGSQRFASPSNMQCVLSSLYLISSAVTEVCVHACVCVLLWLHSCVKRGNIMYPISPSFHFASRGQLTELPSTFQLFYWVEMFSLARRVAENPPNYTCHVAWSCPPWQ